MHGTTRAIASIASVLAAVAVATPAMSELRYGLSPIPPGPLRDGETFSLDIRLRGDPGDVLAGFAVSLRWDVDGDPKLTLESFNQSPYVRFGSTLLAPAATPLAWAESTNGQPGFVHSFNQFAEDPQPLEEPTSIVIGRATWRWKGGAETARIELGEFNASADGTWDDFAPLSSDALHFGAVAVAGVSDTPCIVDLAEVEYDGRAVQVQLSMESVEPTVFTLWVFQGGGLQPIWYASLPTLAPAISFPLSVPFDQPGTHYFVAGMVTQDNVWCADVESVEVDPLP